MSEYSKRETDYMRGQGHRQLADEIDAQQPQLERYQDPAEPILRAHGIDADTAASLWDDFHNSRTSAGLMTKLEKYSDLPAAVKHELFVSKQKGDPAPGWLERVDKVIGAIESMKGLAASPARGGTSSLKVAESHPTVLQALMDAHKHEK